MALWLSDVPPFPCYSHVSFVEPDSVIAKQNGEGVAVSCSIKIIDSHGRMHNPQRTEIVPRIILKHVPSPVSSGSMMDEVAGVVRTAKTLAYTTWIG